MEKADVEALIQAATNTLQQNFDEKLKQVQVEAKQQQELLLQKLSSERDLNERLIKQLRDSMIGSFKEWIDSIKSDVSNNTFAIGELTEKVKNVDASKNENFDHEISFGHHRNKNSVELNSEVTDQLVNIEQRIKGLEDQIDNVEDQSRRNNLKFFGIPDTGAWESWEQSEANIRTILSEKMKFSNAETIGITRAHRLSKTTNTRDSRKQENDPRPIIVKFDSFKDRQAIIMASGKLRNTPLSITEDFCARTNKYRNEILKPRMDAQRDAGKYAVMRHRRLIVKDKIVREKTDHNDIEDPVPTNNLDNTETIDTEEGD